MVGIQGMNMTTTLPSAREWLKAAVPGHCGLTADATAGDCADRWKGSLGLPATARSWEVAARECISRCARCTNCAYITVSLSYRDCSFYRECDVSRPRGDAAFLSGHVRLPTLAALDSDHTLGQRLRRCATHLDGGPCARDPSTAKAAGAVAVMVSGELRELHGRTLSRMATLIRSIGQGVADTYLHVSLNRTWAPGFGPNTNGERVWVGTSNVSATARLAMRGRGGASAQQLELVARSLQPTWWTVHSMAPQHAATGDCPTACAPCADCLRCDPAASWPQWARLREAYDAARAHERVRCRPYAWFVRLRTDLRDAPSRFLPLEGWAALPPHTIFVGEEIYPSRVRFGDTVAVVPCSMAKPFFRLADAFTTCQERRVNAPVCGQYDWWTAECTFTRHLDSELGLGHVRSMVGAPAGEAWSPGKYT